MEKHQLEQPMLVPNNLKRCHPPPPFPPPYSVCYCFHLWNWALLVLLPSVSTGGVIFTTAPQISLDPRRLLLSDRRRRSVVGRPSSGLHSSAVAAGCSRLAARGGVAAAERQLRHDTAACSRLTVRGWPPLRQRTARQLLPENSGIGAGDVRRMPAGGTVNEV